LVTFVLRIHNDDMQARLQSSTAPQFQRDDKVLAIVKGLFLRGQLNRKLNDRQLGSFFSVGEDWNEQLQIGVTL
jgi:hypothetical protein